MSWRIKSVILVAIFVGLIVTVEMKPARSRVTAGSPTSQPASTQPLPKMIELGSVTCVPCKAMKPILDDLEANYSGQFRIEFIDVTKDPDAMVTYDETIIPTQIFLAPDSKELFRHNGFYSKDEILTKWRELGYGM